MDDFGNDLFHIVWTWHNVESLEAHLTFIYDSFQEV